MRLRTFVTCDPVEAARRQVLKDGLDPNSEEGRVAHSRALNAIITRNTEDANRPVDGVNPDEDAIIYFESGTQYNGRLNGETSIAEDIFERAEREPHRLHRVGVGVEANRTGLQVLFDTTDLPKDSMVDAYEQMFLETMSTH